MKRKPVNYSHSRKVFNNRAGKTNKKNLARRTISRGGQVL